MSEEDEGRRRRALALDAEALVASELARRGFAILGRNVRVGRLEIDLIARRGSLVVFCEVRSRASSALLDPIETIDRSKAQRIRRAAARWLAGARLGAVEVRFDAASVVFDCDPARLDYFENAF